MWCLSGKHLEMINAIIKAILVKKTKRYTKRMNEKQMR